MMLRDKIKQGDRFGRLLVTGEPFIKRFWKVEVTCDCGIVKFVALSSLNRGLTQSCGCLHRERSAAAKTRHGMTGTRLYEMWRNMRSRCSCKNTSKRNRVYREKNVTVCKSWNRFEVFYAWAMANGYRDDLEIDRIDGSKGYYPSNCRFVSEVVQSRNTNRRRDNSSGFIGVQVNRRDGVFYARVRRGGVSHHLGSFTDPFSAAWVRDAYLEHHGDIHAIRNNLKDRRRQKSRRPCNRRGLFDWKRVLSK